jgi:alkaline phosphatase D
MSIKSIFIILLSVFTLQGAAQSEIVMLGHVGIRNAEIWVYWPYEEEKISLEYNTAATPNGQVISLGKSDLFLISKKNQSIGKIVLSELLPNRHYTFTLKGKYFTSKEYEFTTQELWQWRKDAPDFSVVFGSCTYVNDTEFDRPGKAYGQSDSIFNIISALHPNAMIWGGDNIYLREGDFETQANMEARYLKARQVPSIQKLLSSCPQYAVWDDHDFGPNDSHSSFQYKKESLAAFKEMWGNSNYGFPKNENNCITGKVSLNDVDLYLMDNRTFRIPPGTEGITPQMLGKEQIHWLIEDLKTSKASFKLVTIGSQVLSSVADFENFATYKEEQEYLLQLIARNNIKNVVFLTGDRHFAELSEVKMSNNLRIIDITASPLTSKPYSNSKEVNTNRVEGTFVGEQNFAHITFSGTAKERTLNISLINKNGKTCWKKSYLLEP